MKKQWMTGILSLTALTLTTLSAPGTAAAGIGVGNGGDGPRAAYIEKLKAELGVEDGARLDADGVSAWCDQAISLLRREQRRAMLELSIDNLDAAEQILSDAIIAASQASQAVSRDPYGSASPMAKRMIDRGAIYTDVGPFFGAPESSGFERLAV